MRGDAKGRVIAMEQKATLVLENGMVFEGSCFGAVKEVVGELVFTTAMTGYLETLTDPSMYGQIVVQTFPLIGNVGVIPSDFESETPVLKAYIVRDWCQEPSNFRCEGDLDTFLKAHGVVGLYGVDTRALTRIVRESGVMNAKILTRPVTDADMAEMKAYRVERAVKAVGSAPETVTKPEGETKRRVVLWNFGAKKNIERELLRRGCEVTAVGKILAVFKKDQQEIIIEIAGQGVPDKGGVEMDDQIVHFLAVGQLQSMIIGIGQDKHVARADIVELIVDMIRAVARGHAGNFQLVVGMSFSRHRADEHMAVDGNQLAAVLIQNGAGGRER